MAAKSPKPSAGQDSLFGFDADPTDRFFYAIYPEPAVADRIALLAEQIRTQHRIKAKPLGADRFHITLNHLGDFDGLPADIIAKAKQAGASIAASSFELTFDRVESFLGRTRNAPLVLRGAMVLPR